MGDAAKGIRAFKDGLKGEEETPAGHRAAHAADCGRPGVEPVSTVERDRSNV